nr:hypothetical protein [Tanacetum cinerariifolium]
MAPLTFADTHNMIAFLTKSDASKGFDQIVDFLNAHTIQYTLIVNPSIYVSCIKQFWASVSVRKTNDVVTLQALINRKKVVITEDIIRQDIRLDDADGVECLPNEETFAELARMGYEKPPRKLTFYKAFFFAQRKFLIHTIVQCMSAKRTAWNEFSSSMASAFICLATEQDKVAQALEITKIKQRVKKLERKRRSKHSGLKRGYIQTEGKIVELNADEDVTLVDVDIAVEIDADILERMEEESRKLMLEYNKVQTLFIPNKDVEEPAKKRGAKETLLQESFKKLRAKVKASGSHTTQEYTPTDDPKEMSAEDVKNIVGGITQAYMIFEDMLKDFDRVDLDALWRLTKEKFSTAMPTKDKEKALFIELKRLYEPNAAEIKLLQAQLGDQKGKSKGTPCVSDTLDPLPQKLENDKVISPRMFRINPFENSMEEKSVPNKSIKASVRTNRITVSQHHVITKKVVNSDSNGFSSTRVNITTKTRRNLLLSNNKKHMSSECNNVELAIRNKKSKIVYAMCKQCLITANHGVCVLNYVNGINSHGKKQKANVSNSANQMKHMPHVKKPKKVGFTERLASLKDLLHLSLVNLECALEQRKEKHVDNIKKYQSLKRKPIFAAQARKNMIVYLNNMVGYKIQYFKGITYDQKRTAKETLLQESFKKLRAEVEVLDSHFTQQEETLTVDPAEISKEDVQNMLQIVPVAKFKVGSLLVKVGGITEAYHSFEDMLKSFDKEDLDALWRLVKEKFSTIGLSMEVTFNGGDSGELVSLWEEAMASNLIHTKRLEDFPELINKIQSLLESKEAARTCVLSKSWLHAWSMIPNLRFGYSTMHYTNERNYMNLIDSTLQRYLRDHIPIQSFDLNIMIADSMSTFLVGKWIRSIAIKSRLKELNLTIACYSNGSYSFPDEIFSGENLDTVRVKAGTIASHQMSNNLVINCLSLRVLELQGLRTIK